MRNSKLLDRQTELLRHLTSAGLIFGDGAAEAAQDPSLRELDIARLRLEAEMSFQKRMGKIGLVLRRTFAHLGSNRTRIFRDFAASCPPRTYKRYEDALSFFAFLGEYWHSKPPEPPYILEIARLELAMSRINAFQTGGEPGAVKSFATLEDITSIQLAECSDIIQCSYDLRTLFESQQITSPPERENYVIVFRPGRRSGPRVLELSASHARMLGQWRQWTRLRDVLTTHGSDDGNIGPTVLAFVQNGILDAV